MTGTDISVIQPEWVPPNLKFEIEDCTQPWTYARDGFDYVHMRYLFGAISDWDSLIGEAFKVCRPGGWVEITDPSVNLRSDDGSVREGTAFYEWGLLFNEVSCCFFFTLVGNMCSCCSCDTSPLFPPPPPPSPSLITHRGVLRAQEFHWPNMKES